MYYLRTKPAATAIQFTVDKTKLKKSSAVENGTAHAEEEQQRNIQAMVCSLQNKDDCLMCSS